MSWDKFKYQQDKKKKSSKQKNVEQKEMWFKAFISDGDLDHKLKKVKEFIKKKHPVKITIKGIKRVRPDDLYNLLDKILEKTSDYAEPQGRQKKQGRNLSVIIKERKSQPENKLINKNKDEKQKEDSSSNEKKI